MSCRILRSGTTGRVVQGSMLNVTADLALPALDVTVDLALPPLDVTADLAFPALYVTLDLALPACSRCHAEYYGQALQAG